MSAPKCFWTAIEAIPGLCAVTAEWKPLLGDEYEAASKFLRPDGREAGAYPCLSPRPCWCGHEVVRHGPGDLVSICCCEPRECATVPLTEADVVVYEVNRQALGDAVARAFGAVPEHAVVPYAHATWSVGTYLSRPGVRFPVYLTVQTEPDGLGRVVDALAARADGPFLLVAPTRRRFKAPSEEPLRRLKAHFVALAEEFVLGADGSISPRRPIEEILAPLLPAVPPSPKDRLVFQRQGQTWLLAYDGVTKSVRHSLGMAYICRLLQSPGEEIHAAVLRSAVTGVELAHTLGSAGDHLDPTTLRKYRDTVAEIDRDLAEADSDHDLARKEALQEDRERVLAELRRALGLGGRKREASSGREKARNALSHAIHAAYRAIQREHEPLWRHLTNSLNVGEILCYRPDQTTVWTT